MRLLFTTAFVCLLFIVHAQVQRCHTDEYLEVLKRTDATLQSRIEAARQQAAQFRNSQPAQKTGQRAVITIPVVVHVMYKTTGQDSLSNISDEQILSQFEVLNKDYMALNTDINNVPAHFQSVLGNPEIQFCLAQLDPEGNPTTGIERIDMGTGTWNDNRKVATTWDNEHYLNLWVAPISGGTLGYATFPGTSPDADGVVIHYRYFGKWPENPFVSDFDLGRTATHEIGHWLGLDHTFQSGCAGMSAADCDSEGDRICDTPPTDNPNYGCSLSPNRNTCTETPNLPDMWMNYLDYMDDACLYMFTQDQVDVMRTVLNTSRSGILNSLACDAQNLFTFSGQVVDEHTGAGVPDAKVLFTGTGKYEVQTDSNGYFSTPNFREGNYAIYAGKWGYMTTEFAINEFIDPATSAFTIPIESGHYYDDFILDYGWGASGTAASGLWERDFPEGTDYSGNECNPGNDITGDFGDECFVTGNGGGSAGSDDVDDGNVVLSSPLFDLSDYNEPYISYYRWFFNNGGQGSPDDEISISLTNGTQTVTLETVNAGGAGSQWAFRNFRVADFLPPSNVMQFIVETSDEAGTGHLVEAGLDVFQVVDSLPDNVGVDPVQDTKLFIYPNPAHTTINVLFDSKSEPFTVMMLDVSGRLLHSERFSGTDKLVQVNTNSLPNGVYVLKIMSGRNVFLRKATVMH